jgi:transcriptional regulator with XRE-family HTH domain
MSKTVSYAQWSLEPYCIGLKLRSLRTGKRLTLSRLAAETGLSTALLSKLETDPANAGHYRPGLRSA